MKLISKWLDLKMVGNRAPVPLVASSFLNATDNYYPFDGNLTNYTYLKDANTSTGWLKIDLGVGTIVNKCNIKFKIDDMPKSLNIEGSNDNAIFEMLHSIDSVIGNIQEFSFENSIPYRYYRLNVAGTDYVGVHEWQLGQNIIEYDERLLLKSNNKIYSLKSEETVYETKMTSNTTPSPLVASASSVYSTAYQAWRAFDGSNSITNSWVTASGVLTGWIQLDFNTEKVSNSLQLGCRSGSTVVTATPKDFDVLGSNDGVNFDTLGEFRNQVNWKEGEVRKFKYSNSKSYRYYRVNILANGGSTLYTSVGEITFSYTEEYLEVIPTTSTDSFINYGLSSIEDFDLIYSRENYILSTTESKNLDGLLQTQINRKPLSIKFE